MLIVAVLAAGCTGLSEVPVPGLYRVDIRQGNALNDAALARLAPGMPRSRVLHLLGTPAIDDVFHADRWEYLYSFARGGEAAKWRRITLHFEGDRLVRVQGDVLPAGGGHTRTGGGQGHPRAAAPARGGVLAPGSPERRKRDK